MKKALLSVAMVVFGLLSLPVPSYAWTTPLYHPIGYTSGAWDLRSTGYECSYWCQLDTGTVMVYGDNLAMRVPGTPTAYGSVVSLDTAYLPQAYMNSGSYGQNVNYSTAGYANYGLPYGTEPAYMFGSYSPSYYGYPLFVGPRGGNTYATSGYYPFVATRPYVGY